MLDEMATRGSRSRSQDETRITLLKTPDKNASIPQFSAMQTMLRTKSHKRIQIARFGVSGGRDG